MGNRSRRLSVGGIFIGALVLMLAGALPVQADCQGGPVWPQDAERVKGSTFIGTFLGTGGPDAWEPGRPDHWEVESVFAGDLPTGQLVNWLGGSSCHPAVFEVGVRYLVSSGADHRGGPDAFNTVAWEVLSGDRLRLVTLDGGRPSELPTALQVATVSAALAASGVDLPPSDTTRRTERGRATSVAWLVVAAAVVLAGMGLSRRRVKP